MDSEKLIEKRLCEWAKKVGGYALKFWPVSVAGLPDRIVLLPGAKIHFVEVKSTGKNPSPMQRIWMAKLEKLGFQVWVVDSLQMLETFKQKAI